MHNIVPGVQTRYAMVFVLPLEPPKQRALESHTDTSYSSVTLCPQHDANPGGTNVSRGRNSTLVALYGCARTVSRVSGGAEPIATVRRMLANV